MTTFEQELIQCAGEVFESTGIFRYETYTKEGRDAYKVFVEIDPGIVDYYRSMIPKWIKLNRQMYAPHISVVRNEFPPNMDVWGKYDGQPIVFYYSNWIYSGTVYYWLNAFSEQLEQLRIELGLPVSTQYTRPPSDRWIKCFHISLGNQKEHPNDLGPKIVSGFSSLCSCGSERTTSCSMVSWNAGRTRSDQ